MGDEKYLALVAALITKLLREGNYRVVKAL